MDDATTDFFDVNNVAKTVEGLMKGSRDGMGRGVVECEIDDMVEGLS